MLPQGWTEHRFSSLGSTMEAARDLADSGSPDRTIVRADMQTGGRGRYGRSWVSEAGNLYATMILRETKPLADCAQLSFAAALSVREALPVDLVAKLKWPNDVLIKGKKIAGILLEAGGPPDAPCILIGVGINVAHFPKDTLYPATSLMDQGHSMDLDQILSRLLSGLDMWRMIWRERGAKILHAAWLEAAEGRGMPIRVRLSDREIRGTFEALDEDGRLIVLQEDGSRASIAAGDVYFN